MQIKQGQPDFTLYDLYVGDQKQEDWVSGDELTGEYELFVTEVPWRGGGKIPDTDNPTGFQTITSTGKVEFKRNGEPMSAPSVNPDLGAAPTYHDAWGCYPPYGCPLQTQQVEFPTLGAIRCFTYDDSEQSATFSSDDGETWLMSEGGKELGQVCFVDTHVTDRGLSLDMVRADHGFEGEPCHLMTLEPDWSWSHEWMEDGTHRRSFTLTSWGEAWKQQGSLVQVLPESQQLFWWLDSLNIRLRQEVGLPV